MLTSEKNFLLSQLADVLSNVESLVSKLIFVKCEDEENFLCPEVPVQIEDEEVSKVKILCQKVVAPSLNLLSKNVMHTLAFDCDVSITTEDDVSSVSSLQSKLSWDITEDYPVSPISDKVPKFLKSLKKECPFVAKIKSFLNSSFPSNVYDSQKLFQERLNESVFIEFQTMWRNVDDLFVQKPDDSSSNCTTATPAPVVRYKSIDFSKVNIRSIANIPKPEKFALYGPSMDPDFYREPYRLDKYGNKDLTLPSHYHNCGGRHGSLYGYLTDHGIVPVPDQPVHGYTWDHRYGSWVLHATFPEERSDARGPWTRTTRTRSPTTRRPPSTRRRWPT